MSDTDQTTGETAQQQQDSSASGMEGQTSAPETGTRAFSIP